jgi:malonyl-CoA O-methyltransferase
MNLLITDKQQQQIQLNFELAAKSYDQFAFVQDYLANKLISENMEMISRANQILDLGCGTGNLGFYYRQKLGLNNFSQADISDSMLELAYEKNSYPCLKFNFDNLQSGNCDLLISSMSIHWSKDIFDFLDRIKEKFSHCNILFQFPGNDSFKEIKELGELNFFPLPKLEELQQYNQDNYFDIKAETVKQYYPNLKSFLKTIKNIGAKNPLNVQQKFLGKKYFQELEKKLIRDKNQQLNISWQIIKLRWA